MQAVQCILARKRELQATLGRIIISKRRPRVATARRARRRPNVHVPDHNNDEEDEDDDVPPAPGASSSNIKPMDEPGQSRGETSNYDAEEEPLEEQLFRVRRREDEDHEEERNFAKFRMNVAVNELIGSLLVLKVCHKMNWRVFLAIVKFVEALLVADQKVLPKNYQQLKRFFSRIHGVETRRVTYCVDCEEITKILPEMTDRPPGLVCHNCQRDVSADVKKGIGTFIYLPLLPQLRSYVQKSDLYEFIQVVVDEVLNIFMGDRFKGVLERGNIPIMVGSDAAPLAKSSPKTVYPIVLSIGNLPYRVTHRFTLLSTVFAGKREHEPPVNVFYKLLRRELQTYLTNPIRWSETEWKKLELTALGRDAPEMRKLANQCTRGYQSCVYCLTHGVYHGGDVRFALKSHEEPQREQTTEHRYRCARKADRKNKAAPFNGQQHRENGVLGLPLFLESDSFHGTKSLVVDMMHVVLLGFLKDIFQDMCSGCSSNHHLQRSAADGFKRKYAVMKMRSVLRNWTCDCR
jgi:hypothetical protein